MGFRRRAIRCNVAASACGGDHRKKSRLPSCIVGALVVSCSMLLACPACAWAHPRPSAGPFIHRTPRQAGRQGKGPARLSQLQGRARLPFALWTGKSVAQHSLQPSRQRRQRRQRSTTTTLAHAPFVLTVPLVPTSYPHSPRCHLALTSFERRVATTTKGISSRISSSSRPHAPDAAFQPQQGVRTAFVIHLRLSI